MTALQLTFPDKISFLKWYDETHPQLFATIGTQNFRININDDDSPNATTPSHDQPITYAPPTQTSFSESYNDNSLSQLPLAPSNERTPSLTATDAEISNLDITVPEDIEPDLSERDQLSLFLLSRLAFCNRKESSTKDTTLAKFQVRNLWLLGQQIAKATSSANILPSQQLIVRMNRIFSESATLLISDDDALQHLFSIEQILIMSYLIHTADEKRNLINGQHASCSLETTCPFFISVHTAGKLKTDHFSVSISNALNQNISALINREPHTAHYLVRLLSVTTPQMQAPHSLNDYVTDSSELFEWSFASIADHYDMTNIARHHISNGPFINHRSIPRPRTVFANGTEATPEALNAARQRHTRQIYLDDHHHMHPDPEDANLDTF
jgi:hypothetical protein